MKPEIGKIVLYNHPGSACGKYPPTQSPAIIQHVFENGSVRLFIFGPKGQHMDDNLQYGEGPCQWCWTKDQIEMTEFKSDKEIHRFKLMEASTSEALEIALKECPDSKTKSFEDLAIWAGSNISLSEKKD